MYGKKHSLKADLNFLDIMQYRIKLIEELVRVKTSTMSPATKKKNVVAVLKINVNLIKNYKRERFQEDVKGRGFALVKENL
jgi:hypothetical protein